MKFTCDKNELAKEISAAHEIISSKNVLSILSNVLLEAEGSTLVIRATDLKTAFHTEIPVHADIPGSTTVLCDTFLNILRSLPDGQITIEEIDEQVKIYPAESAADRKDSSNDIQFNLRTIPAEKFPESKTADEQSYFFVSQKDITEMIDQTIFAVSDDETRFFLNGVYLEQNDEGLTMVATDGRRLSFVSRKLDSQVPPFTPVIIPPKFLHLMTKLCSGQGNMEIAVYDNYIFARFDKHRISSTLIEGKFPNYRRVIPEKQEFLCTMDRNQFMDAFKRVSLLVEKKSRKIYFAIEQDHVTIYSEESDIGAARETIPCEYNGEPVKMALNFLYIMHPVRVMKTEKLAVELQDEKNAIVLRPEPEQDYFHIVMPMQLS